MQRIIWVLIYVVSGAVFFWTPDIIFNAIRGYKSSGRDAIILTGLLPLITGVGFEILWRLRRKEESRVRIAFAMILGIWIFGPLFMTIGWTFSGGGFAKPEGWRLVALGTVLFPILTFMMSTYDGTLFAVSFSSLYLFLTATGTLRRLFKPPPTPSAT